jgi:hypothetical protein
MNERNDVRQDGSSSPPEKSCPPGEHQPVEAGRLYRGCSDGHGIFADRTRHLQAPLKSYAIDARGYRCGNLHLGTGPRRDASCSAWGCPLDQLATFSFVARQLGQRGIAFIIAREALGENRIGPPLKQAFGRTYIANEHFTYETAEQVLATGEADAVAFGHLFIFVTLRPFRYLISASSIREGCFFSLGAN